MEYMEMIEDINIIYDVMEHDENIRAEKRKKRVFRARVNYLEVLDDVEFRLRFRLTKKAVIKIHEVIKDTICSKTTRNNAVPTMVRLLLTLRYFATGSYLTSTGDFVGVSSASACRFIKDVCEALVRLRPSFICFPTDLTPLKQGFYNLAGFPRVMGAIDCMHVAVSPRNGGDVERYRNKEGVLSKNVQIICDADLMIRDIVARWPGSSIDQTVFDNSLIKARFDAGEFDDSILLGDTDYQSQPYLFTPLERTNTPAENLYNEAHILSRNVVEKCVDALKSRFPVLRKRVTLSVERTGDVIVACAVLHNLAVRMKDKHFQFIREQPPDMNRQEQNNDPNIDPRRQLILNHFTSLVKQEVVPP